MPGRALVLANGEPPAPADLRRAAATADWFICCDGALAAALAAGVTPHAVAGDFDSLPAAVPDDVARLATPEQMTNDLEKTFALLVERGFEQVLVLGAGGRRWDQFQANLGVFARYSHRLVIVAEDPFGRLELLRPGAAYEFDLAAGRHISLIPLPAADGVDITNVVWPLHQATLRFDDGGFSMSNEASERPVRVRYAGGCLAAYLLAE